jgi:two-component system phosphate regulon sensor histidine kinase PhoR
MPAEDRVQDGAMRRHFLGIITAETARLTRLINNVLDFARIERGEKTCQFATFDLAALMRHTVEFHRPRLDALGFTLRFHDPPEPLALARFPPDTASAPRAPSIK